MNVLLSAFACSPRLGSEDGIGWRWATEIANLSHNVHVLTRTAYRSDIEAVLPDLPYQERLTFHYLDLSPSVGYEGFGKIVGYVYIYVWQVLAYLHARKLVRLHDFALTHHITFGTIRFPSFLGLLPPPLVYGPAGGGETAPKSLRKGYSSRGKVLDLVRDLSNQLVRIDPLANLTFATSELLLLRTKENDKFVPQQFRHKIVHVPEVAVDTSPLPASRAKSVEGLRIIYIGRFLYWKGMHLGIAAFAKLARVHPDVSLTMVGKGHEGKQWKQLAVELGVEGRIKWIEWVEKSSVPAIYAAHDVLLFPSLHDAGANVVYEAASHGLPTVCLDLGAPGEIVGAQNGMVVATADRGENEVAQALADCLAQLQSDREALSSLSASARAWAKTQNWQNRVGSVYQMVVAKIG